jgi:hypothetical protein
MLGAWVPVPSDRTTLRQLIFGAQSGFFGGRRASVGTAVAVYAQDLPGVASIIIGHGRCRRVPQAILRGDRSACGTESAFAIGELDFGGLAALLGLAYRAAQFVDFRAGCEWHHDLITSLLLCRGLSQSVLRCGLLGRAHR